MKSLKSAMKAVTQMFGGDEGLPEQLRMGAEGMVESDLRIDLIKLRQQLSEEDSIKPQGKLDLIPGLFCCVLLSLFWIHFPLFFVH